MFAIACFYSIEDLRWVTLRREGKVNRAMSNSDG